MSCNTDILASLRGSWATLPGGVGVGSSGGGWGAGSVLCWRPGATRTP
jgi:hypothetical protein